MTSNREVVLPEGSAKPLAPYSPAILVEGKLLYTSGQVGIDPSIGKLVEGGVAAQAKQVMENLKVLLEGAGASFDTVIKTTVFLADMADYGVVNEIYGAYFSDEPPARSAVQVAGLPIGALVEIEAIALVNK
jgi:2-iminobutanoate/2-iminopropanoate deaminase